MHHHQRGFRSATAVLLLGALLSGASRLHASPLAPRQTPDELPDQAQLMIDVQLVGCQAVAGGDGAAVLSVSRSSAAGAAVVAVPAGDATAPPTDTAVTSGFGGAALRLAPGAYWIFVPEEPGDETENPDGVLLAELPDGTTARGWSSILLPAEAQARNTSLTVTVPLVSCAGLRKAVPAP